MKRSVIRLVVALIVVVLATLVGLTLTPALSVTPPSSAVSATRTPVTTAVEPTTTTGEEPTTTTVEPTTTTSAPVTTTSSVDLDTRSPANERPDSDAGDGSLRPGQRGERVSELQQRLRDLGYWVGTPDGTYGLLTVQAVTAFQKVEGLERDGVAGTSTLAALGEAGRPTARSGTGDLIEVDKDRQVLLVVRGGRVRWALNTSTGTEKRYTVNGRTEVADTPPGRWQVGRVVNGVDHGPLGGLYRPRYFHHDGIAVHGYHSVPAYAASHGCVRVSEPAMNWIWADDVMPVGSTVWVY